MRDAKRWYWEQVESHSHRGDTRSMWHGLRTTTGYEIKGIAMASGDSALVDELNALFARFEVGQVVGSAYGLTTVMSSAMDAPSASQSATRVRHCSR